MIIVLLQDSAYSKYLNEYPWLKEEDEPSLFAVKEVVHDPLWKANHDDKDKLVISYCSVLI